MKTSQKYVNDIVRIIIIVCALAIILAFFLPWGAITFMGQSIPISGYTIFKIVASGTFKDFAALSDDMSFIFMAIIVNFLIPVIGAILSMIRVATLRSPTEKFKKVKDTLIINSLFPIFLWVSSLILVSAKLGDFGILGIIVDSLTNVGLWLTTGSLLVIFGCSFLLFQKEKIVKEKTRICPECEYELGVSFKFCPKCGFSFEEPIEEKD